MDVRPALDAAVIPLESYRLPARTAAPREVKPTFDVDRWTLSSEASETAEDRQRQILRDLVTTDKYDARPAALGPHGRYNPAKPPSRGVHVGTDLGDGWRLEGSASPSHHGTVRVSLRAKF